MDFFLNNYIVYIIISFFYKEIKVNLIFNKLFILLLLIYKLYKEIILCHEHAREVRWLRTVSKG
jgi:hypothetical protein